MSHSRQPPAQQAAFSEDPRQPTIFNDMSVPGKPLQAASCAVVMTMLVCNFEYLGGGLWCWDMRLCTAMTRRSKTGYQDAALKHPVTLQPCTNCFT